MSSYGYGPPPPPPPSQPSASYGQQYQSQYQQHGQSHGGHSRGGRGGGYYGGGRGAGSDHQAQSGYGYAPQGSQQYGQQSHYGNAGPHHAPAGYSPPSQHQPPTQQQWSHDPNPQGQHQPPLAPLAPLAPLPPHAYHPNYPPQAYQHQPPPQGHAAQQHQSHAAPYGQQPAYAAAGASQPPYTAQYSHQQPSGPSSQQWDQQGGGHSGHYGGRGRGGGPGSYRHERGGGPKPQMMGPPIRIGFENGGLQGQGHGPSAPVSNGYPQQPPYSGPLQGAAPTPPPGPASYAASPYPGYPPPGPAPAAGPPQHYDNYYSQNSRHHSRGEYQNYSHRGSRQQYSGDKMRHRKPNGSGPHGGGGGGGFQAPPHAHQKPDVAASAGKKKKRKTNTLGLTPGEESDEDELDEEAKLVELIGPDAPKYDFFLPLVHFCWFDFTSSCRCFLGCIVRCRAFALFLVFFFVCRSPFFSTITRVLCLPLLTRQSGRHCCVDRRAKAELPNPSAYQSEAFRIKRRGQSSQDCRRSRQRKGCQWWHRTVSS